MRPLYLPNLRDSSQVMALAHTAPGPLLLPWFFPLANRSAVVGWYPRLLPGPARQVVEVDWIGKLLPSSRSFLEKLWSGAGPDGAVVVVRVRQADEDLDALSADSTLQSFDHVVASCDRRCRGERLGRTRELAGVATEMAVSAYVRTMSDAGMAPDLEAGVRAVASTLLDPVEIFNVANHAIELAFQDAIANLDMAERRLRTRIAVEGLRRLPPDALVRLLGVVCGESVGSLLADVAGADEDLVSAALLIDGKPRRWAVFLEEAVKDGAVGPAIATPAQLTKGRVKAVETALGWGNPRAVRKRVVNETWGRILQAQRMREEGKLDAAEALVATLDVAAVPSRAARAAWFNVIGSIHGERGRLDIAHSSFEEALQALGRSKAQAANRVVALTNLAETARRARDLPKARIYAEDALSLAREHNQATVLAGALTAVGVVAIALGQDAAAGSYLREALALDPSVDNAWYNLGWTLLGAGDPEAAIEPLTRAAELRRHTPKYRADALFTLGEALAKAGHAERARLVQQEAVALDPDSDEPQARALRAALSDAAPK